jgi:hypothetical protein
LRREVRCELRRGAWYRVVRLAAEQAVVDVRGRAVPVARADVELIGTPPLRWTVVPAPRVAPRFPASWGMQYGVCPNCRDRASLLERPTTLRCTRCNGLFDVGWDESYLS